MSIAVGFFDESSDPEEVEGASYTVAGFVASNATSACLELRWKDLLAKYNLEYFKASELSAGVGQFRQYRDYPLDGGWRQFSDRERGKFDEIKTAFTDLIVEVSDQINAIGAVVIIADYERIMKESPLARKTLSFPYYQAGQTVLMEAGIQITKENRRSPSGEPLYIRPIFDSHEEYSGRMKAIFDSFAAKNPVSSRYMLPPYYEDDRRYLSLQVADNIAFEIRKYVLSTVKPRQACQEVHGTNRTRILACIQVRLCWLEVDS
jgi:hypothetical protein